MFIFEHQGKEGDDVLQWGGYQLGSKTWPGRDGSAH